MATLKLLGAENGHVAVWSSYSAVTVSTTQKRTGAYAFYRDGNNQSAILTLTANPVEIYGRVAFYGVPLMWRASTSDNGIAIIGIRDSATGLQVTFGVSYLTYRFTAWLGATGSATVLGVGGVIKQDTWYCLEYHVLIDNANGVVEAKLDGVAAFAAFNGDTQATANTNIGSVVYGATGIGTPALYGYYDDIIINDTTGGVNNTWPGRGGVYMVKPEAVGTVNTMTPLAGTNWAACDEIPPDDDTTYVSSNTPGHKDSYAMSALTPADGTVAAAIWRCRARLAAAGTGSLKYLMREGGVDYNGANIALTLATYVNIEEVLQVAPSGAAWTVAIINAIEAGQEVV